MVITPQGLEMVMHMTIIIFKKKVYFINGILLCLFVHIFIINSDVAVIYMLYFYYNSMESYFCVTVMLILLSYNIACLYFIGIIILVLVFNF